MKQRMLALVLTAAMVLSLLGVSVWAAEGAGEEISPDSSAAQESSSQEESGDGSEETPADGRETTDDGETSGEEPSDGQEPEEYIPDPAGTVTFENLERRMRENNLTLLALEENIRAIEAIDYDEMSEDLRQALNDIASAQWGIITSSPIPGLGSMLASSLDAQYDALREQFDAIKDGELQEDNADAIWQLQDLQNQMVVTGEALYIALAGLEVNDRTMDRSLAALDRGIQEAQLRYDLGQISSLTLQQTRAGRTSLVSSQQTLQMNLENYKTQLKLMVGADLTSDLTLGALPEVTDEQLAAMDLEADLAAAKEASYSLYDAKLTLDSAREDYNDAGGDSYHNKDNYEYQIALHQWQAAQHTYNATVQNFETGFRTLYLQVKDCKQVLDAARTALAVEEDNYAVDQLKYEQGSISQNELLTAQDDLEAAQDAVDTAAINLFSAYNTYRWAVEYGILNG